MIPSSPTDHMELREGSNEDEDFEECVDEVEELIAPVEDQVVPNDEDLVIEEVIDLEESHHDSDIPNKHIKKSNSTEDNLSQSVPEVIRAIAEHPFSESEGSAKPSEGFAADRTGMSQ